MSIEKVLVIDGDRLVRDYISDLLIKKNLEVVAAENGQQALDILDKNSFDIVMTDIKLADLSGIDILRKVKEIHPNTLVIIIKAFNSDESSAEALLLGAFNYIMKPFSPDAIDAVLEKAQEHISLIEENHYLRDQVSMGGCYSAFKIIGESLGMKQILAEATQIAKSNASVLISGESGTGKEVIAHTIHYNSPRAHKPFIKVNCAAMPESLIESEFFGHEKGAFTGASFKKLGRFELANGGTLLLDEVTEIPVSLQAKLLRAIQEQEFERVGGTKSVKVDVRIISTSNRNIQEAVAKKDLRKDLYYRLNVIPINLPPLRERREDIIPLAEYFLEKMCADNKVKKQLTSSARKKLLEYAWPGNIRELANVIERAIVLDVSSKISAEHLHLDTILHSVVQNKGHSSIPVGITLRELEKRFIIETLQHQQNNPTKAAEMLGISVRVLKNKISAYEI